MAEKGALLVDFQRGVAGTVTGRTEKGCDPGCVKLKYRQFGWRGFVKEEVMEKGVREIDLIPWHPSGDFPGVEPEWLIVAGEGCEGIKKILSKYTKLIEEQREEIRVLHLSERNLRSTTADSVESSQKLLAKKKELEGEKKINPFDPMARLGLGEYLDNRGRE